MLRLMVYFLATPAVMLFRWNFGWQFLSWMVVCGFSYSAFVAVSETDIPLLYQYGLPGDNLAGAFVRAGFAVFFFHLVWAGLRNILGFGGGISPYFSGKSILRWVIPPPFYHRVLVEPGLILGFAGYAYAVEGDVPSATFIAVVAGFYLLGTWMDYAYYRFWLGERPSRAKRLPKVENKLAKAYPVTLSITPQPVRDTSIKKVIKRLHPALKQLLTDEAAGRR